MECYIGLPVDAGLIKGDMRWLAKYLQEDRAESLLGFEKV